SPAWRAHGSRRCRRAARCALQRRSSWLRPASRGEALASSLRLRVVLLAADFPALAVLAVLDAALLTRTDFAVGAGARFEPRVARLAALELRRLAGGEAAGLDALLDARLLVGVALDVGLHALRGGRARVASLRVVLLAVD